MDYIKTYKSFIYSHYLTEGLRITSGVLLPAFIMGYFHLLPIGITICSGALFISVTDSPGPIHHRRNGMAVCIAAIFIVTLLAGFAAKSIIVLAVFIAIACFSLSMISVFGTRAASIGTAAMIVLTLSIDPHLGLTSARLILQHSLLVTSGGLWYMCYSMLLYNFRPYRLAQQALGDYIEETSKYLLIRAELYRKNVNYESTYRQMLQQQVVVQNKQIELNELLFKTRSIVRDTSLIGRTLVMINLDTADIFERIMMSYQNYNRLHEYFDETDLLNDYYLLAKELGNDLSGVGVAVKSGLPSSLNEHIREHIEKTREKLDKVRLTFLKPGNIEGFISLRRILENIQDLADRLVVLHKYTLYDRKLKQKPIKEETLDTMISHQEISPDLFIHNLTFKSDTFLHSLRVSAAMTSGYLIAIFFAIGHSYWVLLTIVVILKPAFSLTRKRNTDRILGTVAGVFIGIAVLYLVNNSTALLIILILFMTAAYSFLRVNYFVSVLLMTPYLILFYHFLKPADFTQLLKDRVIDTLIGSAIAVSAGAFLFPSWESGKMKAVMTNMLTEAGNYFSVVANAIAGKEIARNEQRLARKDALVALANLSDAFTRMLSEPKSRQISAESLFQFVVLSHTLTSYIVTLYHYSQQTRPSMYSDEILKVATDIKLYLDNAINYLNNTVPENRVIEKESLRRLNAQVNQLLQKRKQELEAGLLETDTRKPLFEQKSVIDQMNLIYNVVVDISKISKTIKVG